MCVIDYKVIFNVESIHPEALLKKVFLFLGISCVAFVAHAKARETAVISHRINE